MLEAVLQGHALAGIHFGMQPRQFSRLIFLFLEIKQESDQLAPLVVGEDAQLLLGLNHAHGRKLVHQRQASTDGFVGKSSRAKMIAHAARIGEAR